MTLSSPRNRYAWRTALAAGTALAVLAVALGACAKRITEVDPAYVTPEGRFSRDAQLIVWYETPVQVLDYIDTSAPPGVGQDPFCPGQLSPGSDFLRETEVHTYRPSGSINAMILDHTAATAYRPLRREAGGGFHGTLDYPILASRKWLESEWEAYDYNDTRPSGFQPPTYVARGLVAGREGAGSPLTNQGMLRQPTVGDINYTGRCLPCDSLFTLRWDPVPGAARYWLQVYQTAPGTTEDQNLQTARLSPVNVTRSRDFLLGYVPASVTSYKLLSGSANLTRLTEHAPNFGQTYRVRIAAVDSSGQMIAITKGDFGLLDRAEGYGLVRLGAVAVFPKHSGIGPPFCQPDLEPADLASSAESRTR